MLSKQDYLIKFEKSLDHTKKEVATLRTGRATMSLLDEVRVEAYGSPMKIHEVGTISVPDASLLVVSPWDKSLLKEIEKGILAANINLSPVVDGENVKVPVPPLTQERRQELIKILHQKSESGRVMIRSARGDVKNDIEAEKGGPGVSEDDIKHAVDELEEVTKDFIKQIDDLAADKEKELLTI